MATLSYSPTRSDGWSAAVNLNFSAVYNPATNETTVTFAESSLAYLGRDKYGTSSTTEITVTAEDNPTSTATATLSTSGSTTGGTKTFTGTPNPVTCVVKHGNSSTSKRITIAGSTTINVYAWSSSSSISKISGSGSSSVSVYTATAYKLTLSNSGANLAAKLSASFFRSSGTSLTNGATIYGGETVEITFSAAAGYQNAVCTVSGVGSISSGGTFAISGNHTVTVTATLKTYTLTINADSHAEVTVKRGTAALTSGATVSHFDALSVMVSAKTGYKISAADINGTAISPDTTASHTVSGAVIITVLTEALSNVFADVDGSRKRFLVIIDDNGARKYYRAVFKDG